MNQPPRIAKPPAWRRPQGVAPGTWDYVNERSIADHYDAFVADTPLCELDAQVLCEHFPQVTGEPPIVLDLGCGTGRSAIPLVRRGYRVVGIDLSYPMLTTMIAKGRDDGFADHAICAVQANLVDLGFLADRTADHAICMFSTLGMIQGSDNRARVLTHAARIVRPGGRLILHVHHRWAAVGEHGGVARLLASWWRSRRDLNHDFGDTTYAYRGLEQMYMHRFSRREMIGLVRQTGWQTEQLLRISIDGSAIVGRPAVAGGFFLIARRP